MSIYLRIAKKEDLPYIAALRREVYVDELEQYSKNLETLPGGQEGEYIVAIEGTTILGFIYMRFGAPYEWQRHIKLSPHIELPQEFEIGRLTVRQSNRHAGIAKALMDASKRWCMTRDWNSSKTICVLAKEELIPTYTKLGLYRVEDDTYTARCGSVTFALMRGKWDMSTSPMRIPVQLVSQSVHGGEGLDTSKDITTIPNVLIADVLDAWFPPSPKIKEAVGEHFDFFTRSSPSTNCTQLIQTIRSSREIPDEKEIVVGSGSSDLIFRALPLWLSSSSKVLLYKHTYSEYPHILKKVIGCQVDLCDEDTVHEWLEKNTYDFVILVNPNSPTGRWIDLVDILQKYSTTNFWVDETYIDFAQKDSLEKTLFPNLYVCKSMSKSYALSGMRVAYLCGPNTMLMDKVKLRTPPWVVSYPAQIAGSIALQEKEYYGKMWEKTKQMKQEIVERLGEKFDVVSGYGNFYVCKTDTIEALYTHMKEKGILIRRIDYGIRIAVRSPEENERILAGLLCF
uniref:N-acetyltransferase domain-containing protein n=1 Tax=viral metagenome TaxID=1070528 RepID=A0A6C0DQ67_9ZZZZ